MYGIGGVDGDSISVNEFLLCVCVCVCVRVLLSVCMCTSVFCVTSGEIQTSC